MVCEVVGFQAAWRVLAEKGRCGQPRMKHQYGGAPGRSGGSGREEESLLLNFTMWASWPLCEIPVLAPPDGYFVTSLFERSCFGKRPQVLMRFRKLFRVQRHVTQLGPPLQQQRPSAMSSTDERRKRVEQEKLALAEEELRLRRLRVAESSRQLEVEVDSLTSEGATLQSDAAPDGNSTVFGSTARVLRLSATQLSSPVKQGFEKASNSFPTRGRLAARYTSGTKRSGTNVEQEETPLRDEVGSLRSKLASLGDLVQTVFDAQGSSPQIAGAPASGPRPSSTPASPGRARGPRGRAVEAPSELWELYEAQRTTIEEVQSQMTALQSQVDELSSELQSSKEPVWRSWPDARVSAAWQAVGGTESESAPIPKPVVVNGSVRCQRTQGFWQPVGKGMYGLLTAPFLNLRRATRKLKKRYLTKKETAVQVTAHMGVRRNSDGSFEFKGEIPEHLRASISRLEGDTSRNQRRKSSSSIEILQTRLRSLSATRVEPPVKVNLEESVWGMVTLIGTEPLGAGGSAVATFLFVLCAFIQLSYGERLRHSNLRMLLTVDARPHLWAAALRSKSAPRCA